MNVLSIAIKAAWEEIATPESYRKGDEFAAYVRAHLFPKDKYVLVQKTHDYVSKKNDYIESTKEPDFKFRSVESGREFFVEAKYRSNFYDGGVDWCKPYQLKRYRGIDRKTRVYVVIGIGRTPDAPAQVFLIPMQQIKHSMLFPPFLKPYEVEVGRCIDESQLRHLLRHA